MNLKSLSSKTYLLYFSSSSGSFGSVSCVCYVHSTVDKFSFCSSSYIPTSTFFSVASSSSGSGYFSVSSVISVVYLAFYSSDSGS
jgi:hypothetical protein